MRAGSPASRNLRVLICSRLAPNPVDDAGLLSFATFSWLTPVMIRSYKHTLTVDTLPPLSPYDSSDVNAKRYQGHQGSGIGSKGFPESLHLLLTPLWKLTPTRAADPWWWLFNEMWTGLPAFLAPVSGECADIEDYNVMPGWL